jgi:hypothetical protein
MPEFTAKTKVHLECKQCKTSEVITLGDLPHTPKGKFILPVQIQCAKCLRIVAYNIIG